MNGRTLCHICGVEAPTKYVEFHQNIGMFIARKSKSIKGNMCKSCIHRYFWEYTLITLFVGWWGMISAITTPFILLNNIVRYLLCLQMQPVPVMSRVPQLTEEVISKANPYAESIILRINSGEELESIAYGIGHEAKLTAGEVAIYTYALIHQLAENQESDGAN